MFNDPGPIGLQFCPDEDTGACRVECILPGTAAERLGRLVTSHQVRGTLTAL